MKKTKETWKPVVGYEGLYEVSSKGNVRNLKTGRILKPIYCTQGYARVNLTSANNDKTKQTKKLVHRLVAQAFIPNLKNLSDVNHKDEIKTNNNLDNLEWISHRDNLNYGTRNERVAKSNSKPIQQLDMKTGLIIATYPSLKEASLSIGIHWSNISRTARGKYKTAGGYGWKYQSDRTN